MTQFNQRLEELRGQIAQKNRLENILKDLKTQRQDLSDKVSQLEKAKLKEQKDVDKLNGRSLAAFYYSIVGKKDAQLDKEQQEAYAAKVKYDAALNELNAVDADIQSNEAKLCNVQDSEQQYRKTLQEKASYIKSSGYGDADKIMELEKQLSYIETQIQELNEAISAGKCALSIAEKVQSHLDSAEDWGTWDMFGGGLLADMAKYEDLDEAQGLIEDLQVQLRRFKTELADVTIQADIQVSIDDFLHFADYFFDGLFADWAVMDQINQSQEQVKQTIKQIEHVLSRLDNMATVAEQKKSATKETLDDIVFRAKI